MRPRASAFGRMRGFAAAVACVAALGLVACGDEGDDSPEPTTAEAAAVRAIDDLGTEMTEAMRDADMRRLCSLMEARGLKQKFGTPARCAKRMSANLSALGQAPRFEFSEVTVNGDQAMAHNGADNSTVYFVRTGDGWLIDLVPDTVKFAAVDEAPQTSDG